jgi:hypothetical protein
LICFVASVADLMYSSYIWLKLFMGFHIICTNFLWSIWTSLMLLQIQEERENIKEKLKFSSLSNFLDCLLLRRGECLNRSATDDCCSLELFLYHSTNWIS